jgi:ATP phosphoribosyltransferase|tara:strand:+ start:568 stop:1314 length:747 start_codon:yes stop_codon:yes gene_type:complete
MSETTELKLVIPSDGAMYESTLEFMEKVGLSVTRESKRRYIADIPNLSGVTVLLLRSADITATIEDGSADIGLLGEDRYLELRQENLPTTIILGDLKYGDCSLALGIPNSWSDVSSIADVAEVAVEFRERGLSMRVATKSPRLTERYLLSHGINYFSLVRLSGTLELAPEMGFADIIADITSTGTTMEENQLKTIQGGTIIESEACLIGNTNDLSSNITKRNKAKQFIKTITGYFESRSTRIDVRYNL